MNCPKCKKEMEFEDAIHRWNVRYWWCQDCDENVEEDITGELIDAAKDRIEEEKSGVNK